MARKRRKSSNGTGQSVTVFFDASDPDEAAALAMAQLLASKHGRRKDAIIALLSSMYQHYQTTGEIMNATAITNALHNGAPRASMGFTYAVASAPAAPASAAPASHTPAQTRQPGGVVVTSTAKKASAQEIASNFLSSMGSLFD